MRRWLCLVALALACSRGSRQPQWPVTVAERHAEADRLIDSGDRAEARRVLAAIVKEAPATTSGGGALTRRVLLQDTQFRLARLALDAREPAEAARHADEGLALGGEPDLFTANLLVVRGAAHEALGRSPQAIDDYQRALKINEALLNQTIPSP